MRRRAGRIVFSCLLFALSAAARAQMPPLSLDGEVPDLFPGADEEALLPVESDALPRPSIREPFSIGEALYDPSRVPAAVVSLLDLMGVPVVADQAAADRAPGLTLSEAEVRALIDQGVEDASAAAENEEGSLPYSFADLHTFVAPFLRDANVEQLAERYAEAYERRPDDLVPKVLMGQPIVPETPLSRVQIWLLLVDGFVGPGARAAAADLGDGRQTGRPTLAVYRRGASSEPPIPVAAPAGRWGTAQGPLSSLVNRLLNTVDLPWVMAHLPLIQSRVPLTISPANGVAHEGHGGSGARVQFEARIGAPAAPVVAPSGRPVLIPLASPTLSGHDMRWNLAPADKDKFDDHGTLQGTLGSWVPSNGKGALPLSYVPKRENANGVGSRQRENALLRAQMRTWDLLTSRYELAPEFQGLKSHFKGLTMATAPVRLEWHSDGLDLLLTNVYDVALDFGPLGKTHRYGLEGVRGSLQKLSDGTYRGVVRARSLSEHVGGGLGKVCPEAQSDGTQWLTVKAKPVSSLNRNQDPAKLEVKSGRTDGGYLALTFEQASEPVFVARDACQDADELLRKEGGARFHLLPFNDARWWTPEVPFVIAIPRQGKMVYDDKSLADLAPPADLGPFRAIIKGTFTKLQVEVERTDKP